MNEIHPYVILVEPQLAENVGMAARAMMNCGLYHMRLVNPREDHLSDKAVAASSNAGEILEKAEVFRLYPGSSCRFAAGYGDHGTPPRPG